MKIMRYVPTIGLEIHVELKTKTKMFCDSANDPDETHPNINICPVCMGYPGTLPTINKMAIHHVLRVGAALGGTIADTSYFERKNYFYPDLPKGYQISQNTAPLVRGGALTLIDSGKRVRIHHIHLEEDAGRLVHVEKSSASVSAGKKIASTQNTTLVDFNRAGIPLMELVTEPDINTVAEAEEFAREFQLLLRYLGVSDADMEKGQMRVEVNVSLAPENSGEMGTKVEVKNINSFRAANRAVGYEIFRQEKLLYAGKPVMQETRGWDEEKQKTVAQRSKEKAHDYRYFPEPDLPILKLNGIAEFNLEQIRASIPELPQAKRRRLQDEYGMTADAAVFFMYDPAMADYFEAVISELISWVKSVEQQSPGYAQKQQLTNLAVNYLRSDMQGLLKEKDTSAKDMLITPENFAELIKMIYKKEITSRVAKDVLRRMFAQGADPSIIVQEEQLGQMNDKASLVALVGRVVAAHQHAARDYKAGKENAVQFLVGQAMRDTKGSADPEMLRRAFEEFLEREI